MRGIPYVISDISLIKENQLKTLELLIHFITVSYGRSGRSGRKKGLSSKLKHIERNIKLLPQVPLLSLFQSEGFAKPNPIITIIFLNQSILPFL